MSDLLRFALEGERVQRAARILERVGPDLGVALRRAVPFLARRGSPVTVSYARAEPLADAVRDLARPLHATAFDTAPGGARGALVIDAGACTTLLDGVLGGDGRTLPELDRRGLSPAQAALLRRVTDGVLRAMSEVLGVRAGVTLAPRPPTSDDASIDAAPIVCALDFEVAGTPARIVIAIAKEALLASAVAARAERDAPADDRVAGVVENVELDLVAELGRVKMPLSRVAALAVGDTLRLDLPVHGLVSVRAHDKVILRGRPTTAFGRIAVRVEPARTLK